MATVETAGVGGSGHMSRYRAGNWRTRWGRPDFDTKGLRGDGSEIASESGWDIVSESMLICPWFVTVLVPVVVPRLVDSEVYC